MDAATPSAKSATFWDVYSRVYDGVYHLIPYRSLLWDVYDSLELRPGMRVLDAGCGTGNFEHFIAGKPSPRITIDALDASEGMLEAARRKCRGLEHVRFSAGDLGGRLPFDDDTFDRVVSINVIYALEDQDHVVSELLRVLKPDGRLVISSPLPSYRVSRMLADHFRRIGNIWGPHRRLARVAETIGVLATTGAAQWMLNNHVIDAREAEGRYRSLDRTALEDLLGRRAEDGLGQVAIRLASADQNLFATAVKVALA